MKRRTVWTSLLTLLLTATILPAGISANPASTKPAIELSGFDYWKTRIDWEEEEKGYYGQYEQDGDRSIPVQMTGDLPGNDEQAIVTYEVKQVQYTGAIKDACAIPTVPPQSGKLVFTNQSRTASFTIPITDDSRSECTEYYVITLKSESGNAYINMPYHEALLYVFDDDQATLSFTSGSSKSKPLFKVAEDGASQRPLMVFTSSIPEGIMLLGDLRQDVSADLSFIDCCATKGVDYKPLRDKITFRKIVFERGKEYTYYDNPFIFHEPHRFPVIQRRDLFTVIDDQEVEKKDEVFKITLANPVNAKLGSHKTGYVAIVDNDKPCFKFDMQVINANQWTQQAAFTISRNSAEGSAKALVRTRLDDTTNVSNDLVALPGVDFVALEQWVEFAPGETTKTVYVQTIGHNSTKWGKLFYLELLQPSKGYSVLNEALVRM
ncbi:hypothetical protein DNH61_21550 [Paenibacillus sambharensis]|uniref:Calx-beta domain-containing protein n=1 Tax=Paenibacillus sambharensis TaxID=1803190 RepID=A0A2W1L1H1_9BACL|nr:Calx-beta domain-containing protein [Paenibacillus sambharensis]PZD93788.1 hypothetical protein DNH61_21550 [Paenibacillus sambharensis]